MSIDSVDTFKDYEPLNIHMKTTNKESADFVLYFYKGNIDKVKELFDNNDNILLGLIYNKHNKYEEYICAWKYLCNYVTNYKDTIPNIKEMCYYLGYNFTTNGKKWLAIQFGFRGGWEDLIEMGLRSGCTVKTNVQTSTLSNRIVSMILHGIDYDKWCSSCYSSYKDYDTMCHVCICL